MLVILTDEAERDLIEGIVFYESQGPDVGTYFFDSIAADLRSLSILGGVHVKRSGYHCMGAKRFPYSIYYFVHDEVVSVVAILDERRDPAWIENRLRQE